MYILFNFSINNTMNKDSNHIFEKYMQIYIPKNVEYRTHIKELYENDLIAINELLEEAGFWSGITSKIGSAVASAGEKVKQAASDIKSSLTSSIATSIVNLILKKMDPSESKKLIGIIQKGKISPQDEKEIESALGNKDNKQQEQGNTQQVNASYENKRFLAQLLFTEENLAFVLKTNSLLLEAKGNKQLDDIAKEMAQKIQALYPKNKRAMMNAISKMPDKINKFVGSTQQTAKSVASTTKPSSGKAVAGPANQKSTASQQTTQNNTQQTANTTNTQSAGNGGLIQKIKSFVTKHPKISAGIAAALLGVVVAAFAGAAPVVSTALIAAAKSGLIAGGVDVIRQMVGNKSTDLSKVNLKQTAKMAGIGAATGGAVSVLATGLGNIAGAFKGIFHTGDTGASATSQHSNTQPDTSHGGNNHGSGDYKHRQMDYQKDIAKATGGEKFTLKQGVPYDQNGNQLVDDETVKKIAAKHNITTKFSGTRMSPQQYAEYMKNPNQF